ncbi:uncharacterized protein LOC119592927 [Penaeus monodon]|uniref:uncharacterized protein LOC119592927 n=1 Tax=Penaeus monodon TaxID=6687 RepID=UPI0018A6F89A|nr:uncharacterized protein LOC119592927 [Penaeus monodon]
MQTKNVNVAQPTANKNEKNAVAAATVNVAHQNGQAVNGSAVNGSGVSVAALNGQTSVPIMNGMNVNNHSHTMNGTAANSMAMNGSLMNGAGMNGQITSSPASPYQHLPVTSTNQHLVVSSPYHPVTSANQLIGSSSVTSANQLIGSSSVTSANQLIGSSSVTSPYQPPPLPPRVGTHRPAADLPQASHPPPSGGVHSVYKPVPPPKPYSSSASAAHTGPGAALSTEEQQQQQAGTSRDQVAPVIGSALQAGPPPLLPHILVTDQGHFHTHSTKFPIETKEGPVSLFARSPPRLSAGRSATLGRGVGGVSDLTAAMGVPAKGSTLPRSTRMPSLLDLRPPAHSAAAPHTHTHHAHGPPHSHGTASVEDRDQLLGADQRPPRYLDGIDNPALVDDASENADSYSFMESVII